ncbi:MAG: hypothetical protein WAU01_14625 [Saprospiraceae bacterium]
MINTKELIWVKRYSDTDKPDKQGRLARQLFYKGKHICLITRIKLPRIDTFQVFDYFPSNGNDSPCYSEMKDDDLVVLKHKAEQRFIKFLNDIK